MGTYLFADPPDTRVLTLRRVLGGRPALVVQHDEGGGWYFYDGASLFERFELVLAPLGQLVERDPDLNQLADLPRGWQAWRNSPEEPWERESSKTLDRSREKVRELLEQMRQMATPLPPGSPSTTDLIREARGQ
jgi:hypothetical protein